MQNFVHLHVHTQYSLLDGQASIPRLVDKALKDGMPGIAVTDHGNMFGIKEFWNYVAKKNGQKHDNIKRQTKLLDQMNKLLAEHSDLSQYKDEVAVLVSQLQSKIENSKEFSIEDNEELAKYKSLHSAIESMEKEFNYDPQVAQEKIDSLKAIDDFKTWFKV